MIILPKIGFHGVYIIINLKNKKIYIGSSKNVYHRLHRHKSEIKLNKHWNYRILEDSLDGNFLGMILENCNENELVKREQYWINILTPEYNITKNVINNIVEEESKIKISNTLKRKYKSGEITTYKQDHAWVKVDQYTLDGIYINTYNNIVEAGKAVNTNARNIGNCLLLPDKRKTAKGFIWKKHEN